jgi:quercetin dioxygenase-like cupin family protein
MTGSYLHVADLAAAIEIPRDGTLSRTLYADDDVKIVLFGFDAGQELSEHTASRPALLQIVRGEGRLTLGGDAVTAAPGTFVRMPAGLPHSVRAETPLVMLLVLLPVGADAA